MDKILCATSRQPSCFVVLDGHHGQSEDCSRQKDAEATCHPGWSPPSNTATPADQWKEKLPTSHSTRCWLTAKCRQHEVWEEVWTNGYTLDMGSTEAGSHTSCPSPCPISGLDQQQKTNVSATSWEHGPVNLADWGQNNEVITERMADAGIAILHSSSPMVGITPPEDVAMTPPGPVHTKKNMPRLTITMPTKMYSNYTVSRLSQEPTIPTKTQLSILQPK